MCYETQFDLFLKLCRSAWNENYEFVRSTDPRIEVAKPLRTCNCQSRVPRSRTVNRLPVHIIVFIILRMRHVVSEIVVANILVVQTGLGRHLDPGGDASALYVSGLANALLGE